jgi:hypothetical protein
MKPFLTFFLLGIAWLAPRIHAHYGIDDSCEDKTFIEEAEESAMDMAQKALEAIEPPDGSARDPNVERLLNLLFRPSTPLSQESDTQLLNQVADVFRGATWFRGRTDMVQPSRLPRIAKSIVCTPSDRSVREADVSRTFTATWIVS